MDPHLDVPTHTGVELTCLDLTKVWLTRLNMSVFVTYLRDQRGIEVVMNHSEELKGVTPHVPYYRGPVE